MTPLRKPLVGFSLVSALAVAPLAFAQGQGAAGRGGAARPAATATAGVRAGATAAGAATAAGTAPGTAPGGAARPAGAGGTTAGATGGATAGGAAGGVTPVSATGGGAAPAGSAGAGAAMDGQTYVVRLRDLEQRVDELKEQIRRSHTRLSLLSDTVLSGGVGGSRADIQFQNEMSSAFRLIRALFVLDGAVQYNKADDTGALSDQPNIPIFAGSIPPGDHTVQVLLQLQGNGYGVFSYLKGYKFEVRSTHSFTSTEGKTIALQVIGYEKGGVTTPLEERPAIRFFEKVTSGIQGPLPSGPAAVGPAAPGAPAAPAATGAASAGAGFSIGGGAKRLAMGRFGRAVRAAAWAAACAGAAGPAWAAGAAETAPGAAQRSINYAEREADSVQQIIAKARTVEKTAEQRLADGEMLFRSKDYARAIDVLNELVERHQDHRTAYPDGLMLLGESYYQSRQPLAARRAFRKVVDRAGEARMAPYAPRAYARLVDVALRKQNDADVAELLAMNTAPFSGDPLVQYARAKALVARRDFNGARAAAGAVPPGHAYYHQARYLLGVVTMREAQAKAPPVQLAPGEPAPPAPPSRYAAAIEAFRQVTQLAPDTAEHQHVVDLAWLAIGRLFYEADQWFEAADAYNHVDRQSPEFGASLYELAWVYVRLGDTDRAARALEVLSIADPKNAYMADGALLRADLLLRSGQFDKALSSYQAVRAEYDPMRERVDGFLSSTTDPAVYYDKLSQEELETVDNTSQLPPLAVQLAREERDGASAFAVLDDVSQCRDLIKKSQRLVFKLRTVLGAPNRVRAFPDLRAGDEKLLLLLNRLTSARGTVAEGLDDVEPAEVSGELAQVRRERRDLQRRLQGLPMTDADLITRESVAQRQWNTVSQRLQQLQLEVDQMQAVVNGLKRMVSDSNSMTGRNPAMVQQWQAELTAGERDLKGYREQIEAVRQGVEAGRVQVGYGDQRFVDDEQLRNAFRDKLRQEAQLVAGGAAGSDSSAYGARVLPVLAQADAAETRLVAMRRDIDAEVAKKASELSGIVEREASNITAYSGRLESLDQEARLVVGQVAMRNFGLVRDRLKNIVLRADVGTVEQAWEVREEQVTRVRNLQAERVREEQILREELREVLDDAPDAAPPAPAP